MSGAHLSDSVLYRHLWGTDEMHEIFDDEPRVREWLRILSALADAQASLDIIPRHAAIAIRGFANAGAISLAEVASRNVATGHSTLGLIQSIRDNLPPSAAEWVYYGATVQDLSDTWTSLAMKRVLAIVERDLQTIGDNVAALTRQHAGTAMCGRSHGQPGMPITFGFKTAVWLAELDRHLERVTEVRSRCMTAQLGGALGTMQFWDDAAPELLNRFAGRLGLCAPEISWTSARDRVSEFLNLLAMVTATLGKIGQEIYALQRPEIGEVTESWTWGQVGSITMPHKRNPERSEHLVTLSRLVRMQASAGLEAMVCEHERDGRAWKTEWILIPEACLYAAASLHLAAALTGSLQVDCARMKHNLEETDGYVMSENIMRALAAHVGKHQAHEIVYKAVMRGRRDGLSLKDAILSEPAAAQLSTADVEKCLDIEASLKSAWTFAHRVVEKHEQRTRRP